MLKQGLKVSDFFFHMILIRKKKILHENLSSFDYDLRMKNYYKWIKTHLPKGILLIFRCPYKRRQGWKILCAGFRWERKEKEIPHLFCPFLGISWGIPTYAAKYFNNKLNSIRKFSCAVFDRKAEMSYSLNLFLYYFEGVNFRVNFMSIIPAN